MKILVTAGATMTMIDQVRGITNIFRGRTGWNIAWYLAEDTVNNIEVTLLTSAEFEEGFGSVRILKYKTYDELYTLMEQEITTGDYDIVIHSAAVSDYKPVGTYVDQAQEGSPEFELEEISSAGKVGSEYPVLYLKMVQTEKIVDKIRDPWGFKGKLVKFKLQVGMSDDELCEVAERSRVHSDADIIVANCLEWCRDYAYVLSENTKVIVKRDQLAESISDAFGL